MRKARVDAGMTRPVTTVSDATPFEQIIATMIKHGVSAMAVPGQTMRKPLMRKRHVRRLPVTDASTGRYPTPPTFW